jgi:hypothetical protein
MLVTKQPVLRRFWYAVMPMTEARCRSAAVHPAGRGHRAVEEGRRLAGRRARPLLPPHREAVQGLRRGRPHRLRLPRLDLRLRGACVKIPQQPDMQIPAGARVPAYHCEQKFGYAWVALDDPLMPLLEAEEAALGYRRIHQFDETWNTGALRLMENSFDSAHFAFVHKGTFGQAGQHKPETSRSTRPTTGSRRDGHQINNPPRRTASPAPPSRHQAPASPTSGTCRSCASWGWRTRAASGTRSSPARRRSTTTASS